MSDCPKTTDNAAVVRWLDSRTAVIAVSGARARSYTGGGLTWHDDETGKLQDGKTAMDLCLIWSNAGRQMAARKIMEESDGR